MFTLLLLSALGKTELFFFLFLIALVIGYFIGHTHRIFEIANRVYASLDEHIKNETQIIHAKVVDDLNQFEGRYAVLLTKADRTVEGWERNLRIEIARELLALRNIVHYRFTGKYPNGVLLDRTQLEATQAKQAQDFADERHATDVLGG